MPRKLIIPIVLLVLLLLLLFPSIAKADGIVTFPDANLEAVIRKAIQKPTGDIYQSDLKNIFELRANDREIRNLNGLQYCTSLTYLSLGGNQISDISPLSNLTSLTHLYLSGNQISDISALIQNTGIENEDYVDVRENPLSATSQNDYIPQLEQRGVGVSWSPPSVTPQVLASILIPTAMIILAIYYRHIRHIREKKQQSLELEKAEIIDMIDDALEGKKR